MISLRVQKKLLFIPFLNCAILFIWWFFNIRKIDNSKKFGLTAVYMLAGVAISAIVYVASYYIHACVPLKQPLWDSIIFYILSLIVMSMIIRCQRRLGVE